MPELPEVEVLVRHLAPLLHNQTIRSLEVPRRKTIAPHTRQEFGRCLAGARFTALTRRGKYLVFTLRLRNPGRTVRLVGHLGMTGRMYLLPVAAPLPKHTAAVFFLGRRKFVFEDTRYFGRLTLEAGVLERLGPEPLGDEFTPQALAKGLQRSAQAVKVKLLDQSLVAGVGNIYASEALFRARVSPRMQARGLSVQQVRRLWRSIRGVLREAIQFGSTVPLDWVGRHRHDKIFYYGRARDAPDFYEERLRVYDRAGKPCGRCGTPIRRTVQAARSTFYCPGCQR